MFMNMCKRCFRAIATLIIIVAALIGPVAGGQTILRVDIVNGSTTGDGSGWGSSAFKYLQDALATASSQLPAQVWVAQGIYRPDQGTGISLGDRDATFRMNRNNMAIYGGFAGNEPATTAGFNSRNPIARPTILSGDLSNNDGANFANYGDNSHHVVTCPLATPHILDTAVLDGFTVRGGNAVGATHPDPLMEAEIGGGIVIFDQGPRIVRCVIKENRAVKGGAVGFVGKSGIATQFINCTLADNHASDVGGALACVEYNGGGGGAVQLTNCLIRDNQATVDAGACMADSPMSITLDNCTVVQNDSPTGANTGVIKCANTASGFAGTTTINNSIIHDNTNQRIYGRTCAQRFCFNGTIPH